MTTDRFFAEPVPQDLIAWSWHVVDRQIGRPVEHAQGLGEERARHLADLMNKAGRVGAVPELSARQKGNKHDFDDEDGQVEPDNPSDDGDQP